MIDRINFHTIGENKMNEKSKLIECLTYKTELHPIDILILVTKFENLFGETAVKDLNHFIQWAMLENKDYMSTVSHDLNLVHDSFPETCQPRSHGYSERLEEWSKR
jgi:hypothetical protein